MANLSWGLLGAGNIGSELARQIERTHERLGLKPKPEFILRKSGLMRADGQTLHPDKNLAKLKRFPKVIFVTLPPSDTGQPTYDLIKTSLERGAIVITSEKSAIANHYPQLKRLSDNFKNLGINATVGGGTRMLEVASTYLRDPQNVAQMHLVVNGTLAYIFSAVGPMAGSGMSHGQAVHQAVKLGYAEPGATDPYEVIRSEAEGDIPRKTAILMNYTGMAEKFLNWRELKFFLSDDEITLAIQEAKVRRFIVSVYPVNHSELSGPERNVIGGFDVYQGKWRIVGGFRHIERNPLFGSLASITGPGNGVVTGLGPNETDGVYTVTGPGAGPEPTVNTMLDDYLKLS